MRYEIRSRYAVICNRDQTDPSSPFHRALSGADDLPLSAGHCRGNDNSAVVSVPGWLCVAETRVGGASEGSHRVFEKAVRCGDHDEGQQIVMAKRDECCGCCLTARRD